MTDTTRPESSFSRYSAWVLQNHTAPLSRESWAILCMTSFQAHASRIIDGGRKMTVPV